MATSSRRARIVRPSVSSTDLVQGPFGARYQVQKEGRKRIAVVDDGKTYGVGLTEQFVAEAERLGAEIVAREKVGEKDTGPPP